MLLLLMAATSTVSFSSSGFVLGDGGRYTAIALDGDGAVAAGWSEGGILRRYLEDGRVDPRFAQKPIAGARFNAVTIDRSGRVIAAGMMHDRTLVARFLADGRLDESFGEYGLVRGMRSRSFLADRKGNAVDRFHAVGVDSQGRVVAVGVARGFRRSSLSEWFFCRWFDLRFCWSYENTSIVARFLPGGPLDPGFAGSGYLLGNQGARWHTGPHDELIDLMILPGDRIAAVGWAAGPTYEDERTIVMRLLPDGRFDPELMKVGWEVSGPDSKAGGTKEVLYGIARRADLTITCGFSFDRERHIRALIKIYGDEGEISHMVADARQLAGSDVEYFAKCAVDSFGRISGVGFTDDDWKYSDEPDRALLARYRADGSLGERFHSFSAGRSVFGDRKNDGFYDLAIDELNRVWVVGSASGRALIARFEIDLTLDASR